MYMSPSLFPPFCGATMQKLCLKLPRRLYPKERMPFIRNTAKPHAVWRKPRRSGKSAAIARSRNAFILGGFAKPPAVLLGSPCSPHGSQPAAKLRGGLAAVWGTRAAEEHGGRLCKAA